MIVMIPVVVLSLLPLRFAVRWLAQVRRMAEAHGGGQCQ
jgi:hypothetical protein